MELTETGVVLVVYQDQLSGEGSLSHDGHFYCVSSSGGSDVHGQLELPHDNTEGEEEEEAGEEHGEENKEINVKLVLTKEDVTNNFGIIVIGLSLVNTIEKEVKLGRSQIMSSFRYRDDESLSNFFN